MRPFVLGLLGLLLVTTGTKAQDPYTYTACGGNITGSFGGILSHAGYGNGTDYENNLNCEYSITVNPRKSIRVEFLSMDLEEDRSCQYDKVMVIADGVEQGPFCGTNLPPVMSSASNELVIRWTSDGTETRPGWALRWRELIVGTPDECVFPFNYNGVDYYTCTKEGSNQYWCGTTYEYVDYVDCVDFEPSCQFPFMYNGSYHYNCIDDNSDSMWCSLSFDYDTEQQSIDCPSYELNQAYALKYHDYGNEQCVFPFTYYGIEFDSCISMNSTTPWCSVADVMVVGSGDWVDCEQIIQETGCGSIQTGTEGFLYSHDGFGTTDYENNHFCSNEIIVEEGKQILIDFTHLDIEHHSDCAYDYVLVQEINMDGSRTDLGKFCGNVVPADIIVSTGNHVEVIFYSDNGVTAPGYRAEWYGVILPGPTPERFVVCENEGPQVLTCSSGVIIVDSAFYGRQSTTECGSHDVTDCVAAGSEDIIKELCNGQQSCEINPSNAVFGDPCHIPKYVEVQYHCIDEPSSDLYICDMPYLDATYDWQTIKSNNFPGNYGNDQNCGVTIISNDTVHVYIEYMNLESNFDFLRLYDGSDTSAPLIKQLTGSTNGSMDLHEYFSEGSQMYVHFTSDSSVNAEGFILNFKAGPRIDPFADIGFSICDQSYLEADYNYGILKSPNYPANYDNYVLCGVNIHSNESIHLEIAFFNLEPNYDFVRVYDGYDASAPLVIELTGSSNISANGSLLYSRDIFSTGSDLYVEFSSDLMVAMEGFLIGYRQVPFYEEEEILEVDIQESGNPLFDFLDTAIVFTDFYTTCQAETGYLDLNGYRYGYVNVPLSYKDARDHCLSRGGDLAYHGIEDIETRRAIRDHLSIPDDVAVWSTMMKQEDGSYQNPDGNTVESIDWLPDEPNGDGLCADWHSYSYDTSRDLMYNDRPCDIIPVTFVCEFKCPTEDDVNDILSSMSGEYGDWMPTPDEVQLEADNSKNVVENWMGLSFNRMFETVLFRYDSGLLGTSYEVLIDVGQERYLKTHVFQSITGTLTLVSAEWAEGYVHKAGLTQDCPMELGFCVTSDGADQNDGAYMLYSISGNADPLRTQQECLNSCKNVPYATGCEVVEGNGCYVHTASIDRGNDVGGHVCWVFSKCTTRTNTERFVACEHGGPQVLTCSSGVITVDSAFYGRQSAATECDVTINDMTDCAAAGSEDIIKELCNGQQSCEINPSNGVFGDPCHLPKYVEVVYHCSGKMEFNDLYVGCFTDKEERDFMSSVGDQADMTVDRCRHFCTENYPTSPYYAVQAGKECWCSPYNWTPMTSKYGRAEESECNMPCTGDSTETCGGWWLNQVYRISGSFVKSHMVGCFIDDAPDREFLPESQKGNDVTMTVYKCEEYCRKNFPNSPYYGLQAGQHCFCSPDNWNPSSPKYGQVDNSECNMTCFGDESETCGNHWRNQVYAVGDRNFHSHIGCYIDTGDREFPEDTLLEDGSSMTIDMCRQHCQTNSPNSRYFSVQNGNQCYCSGQGWDPKAPKHGRVHDSECSNPCTGNRNQTCGNSWRNQVMAMPGVESCPVEKGFCVTYDGEDQNDGAYMLYSISGNADPVRTEQECLNSCKNVPYATGCEVVEGNGCYVHTSSISRGNDVDGHVCWVFWKCTVEEPSQDCPIELGFCVTSDGTDQNDGAYMLYSIDGDADPLTTREQCLNSCQNVPYATGCEVVEGNGCYVHTAPIDRGNDVGGHVCWVFSKCINEEYDEELIVSVDNQFAGNPNFDFGEEISLPFFEETYAGWGHPDCVFPFEYYGRQYMSCTSDNDTLPWCSTTSVMEVSSGNWVYCQEDQDTTSFFICDQAELEAGTEWSVLKSTNHPDNYGHSENCGVNIHTDVGGSIVHIHIEYLNLEDNWDWIRFYDGLDDTAPLLAEHSGSLSDAEDILSSGANMFVMFSSDYSTAADGFRVMFKYDETEEHYENWGHPQCVFPFTYYGQYYTTCTGTNDTRPWCATESVMEPSSGNWVYCDLNQEDETEQSTQHYICDPAPTGIEANYEWQTLVSTNHPDPHDNNEYCGVHIHSAEHVVLQVDYMNLEANYDYIYVYDGDSDTAPQLLELTGSMFVDEIQSTGNDMFVVFTSDGSQTYDGFRLNFRTSASAPEPEPDHDDNNLHCEQYEGNTCGAQTAWRCSYAQWRLDFYGNWMNRFQNINNMHHLVDTMDCVIPEEAIQCVDSSMKVCRESAMQMCPVCYCADHQYLYPSTNNMRTLWSLDYQIWNRMMNVASDYQHHEDATTYC